MVLLSVGSFRQVSAGLNGAGQAEVFAVLTDDSLWENSPSIPGGWRLLSPSGTILSISAGPTDEVFAITSDSHLWEYSASGWSFLSSGSFASVNAGANPEGEGDVFATLKDTSLWDYDPRIPGGWQRFCGVGRGGHFRLKGRRRLVRLQAFVDEGDGLADEHRASILSRSPSDVAISRLLLHPRNDNVQNLT